MRDGVTWVCLLVALSACDGTEDRRADGSVTTLDDGGAGEDGGEPASDPDADTPDRDGGSEPIAGTCPGAMEVALPVEVTGDDFHATSEDRVRFSESSCAQLRFGDPHPERIYAVDLAAGQTVGACERGPMPAALYVVEGCDGEEPACLAAAAEVAYGEERSCLRYTAGAPQRVFVVLEPYNTTSNESAPAFALSIALDPSCGDGAREPGEECDDGNGASGDGCDAECFIEGDALCYELGGSSVCREAGCGDGCVFGDLGSECPAPSRDVSQEECDDLNNTSGDGCSAACDVEDGWNCSAAPSPGTCWAEPRYEGLTPASAAISESYPGMRRTGYHEAHLTVTQRLRFTIDVEAFGVGTHPDALEPDRPVVVQPELRRIGTTSDVIVPLTGGSAILEAGTYGLRLRSGADRVGGYGYTIDLGAP